MPIYPEFEEDIHAYVPFWKEVLIRIFGKYAHYSEGCLVLKFRGEFYVIKKAEGEK